MEKTNIEFEYGKTQLYTSPRLSRHPTLARMIYSVFGYTSIGNWARAHIFIDRFRSLPFLGFKKILDLGAGLGEFTFMLAEALPDAKITALEILPGRIANLENVVSKCEFKNVTVHPDKIDTLKPTEEFDFIFSVDVFEHILKEEMPFQECFDKLSKGGYLMVKIPNVTQITIFPDKWFQEHNEWVEDEHIGQVYDLKGLEKRFLDVGFKIVHSSYSDGWISRLGWEISYFSAKMGSLPQLLFLPLCKFIYHIEWLTNRSNTNGNAIQVIGQKI